MNEPQTLPELVEWLREQAWGQPRDVWEKATQVAYRRAADMLGRVLDLDSLLKTALELCKQYDLYEELDPLRALLGLPDHRENLLKHIARQDEAIAAARPTEVVNPTDAVGRLGSSGSKVVIEREGYCGLCGEKMPEGEETFRYHGYSGPCPDRAAARPTEEAER